MPKDLVEAVRVVLKPSQVFEIANALDEIAMIDGKPGFTRISFDDRGPGQLPLGPGDAYIELQAIEKREETEAALRGRAAWLSINRIIGNAGLVLDMSNLEYLGREYLHPIGTSGLPGPGDCFQSTWSGAVFAITDFGHSSFIEGVYNGTIKESATEYWCRPSK